LHPSIHARARPDKPALVMAGSGETVSYRQLDDRSNRVAHLFRSLGLAAGDHVALLVDNRPVFFDLCWGAQRSGIVFTAMSTRLGVDEAAYIADNCGAKAVIASASLAPLAAALGERLDQRVVRLATGGGIDGWRSLEAALATCPATPIADESAGTDMLYSSGTTGRPKGVFLPPESPRIDAGNALIDICRSRYRVGPDTRYLSPAPLYHAAPLRFNMTVMRLGGTCHVMEHFDAEAYLHLVEAHRITHTQLVPTMFVRMLKLAPAIRARYDLSSLQCAIHAAAPCPVSVKEQIIEWWGPVVWEYYAGTEGNGMTLVDTAEWLAHRGTVGRAVVGKLRICDDDGNELPAGERGTVYFAEGRPFSYHGDPVRTAESRNRHGWTTLGDVGWVDGDGYLYLTDRRAYTIISGGVNIYPQEAEDLLVTHPSVLDAAVFGVPNQEFGEEVKAVVQPRDMSEAGPDLEHELIAYCRERLSHLKCPKSVDFERELPRHPTGKLYKRLLRDRYWQGHASRIV
jgi:long-chain acyl-CoA synthetase